MKWLRNGNYFTLLWCTITQLLNKPICHRHLLSCSGLGQVRANAINNSQDTLSTPSPTPTLPSFYNGERILQSNSKSDHMTMFNGYL